MPDRLPSLSPAEIRASIVHRLSRIFELRCEIQEAIAYSRRTLAESKELLTKAEHVLGRRR